MIKFRIKMFSYYKLKFQLCLEENRVAERLRIALRNAPLTEEEKPVKAGEIGGRYKPLVKSKL